MDIVQLKGDLFIGGLLSVNELGIPIEFIHSEQIRPTALQISLYGSTLGRYLLLDVVGKGLMDASQQRNLPLVVASRDMLALGSRLKQAVCCLNRSDSRPLSDPGELNWLADTELQVQLEESRSPLQFSLFSKENFAADKTLPVFSECCANFDLLEPLSRVKRTLESLQREQAVKLHA